MGKSLHVDVFSFQEQEYQETYFLYQFQRLTQSKQNIPTDLLALL